MRYCNNNVGVLVEECMDDKYGVGKVDKFGYQKEIGTNKEVHMYVYGIY